MATSTKIVPCQSLPVLIYSYWDRGESPFVFEKNLPEHIYIHQFSQGEGGGAHPSPADNPGPESGNNNTAIDYDRSPGHGKSPQKSRTISALL